MGFQTELSTRRGQFAAVGCTLATSGASPSLTYRTFPPPRRSRTQAGFGTPHDERLPKQRCRCCRKRRMFRADHGAQASRGSFLIFWYTCVWVFVCLFCCLFVSVGLLFVVRLIVVFCLMCLCVCLLSVYVFVVSSRVCVCVRTVSTWKLLGTNRNFDSFSDCQRAQPIHNQGNIAWTTPGPLIWFKIPASPNCPLRQPKYHLIETTRPLIQVHWGA